MKSVRLVLLGVVLLMLTPSLSAAQEAGLDWADKNGAIGLGANVNLGGSAGMHIRTYLSPYFGLMGTFGMSYATVGNANVFGLDAGIYGMLKVAPFDVGHISLLFGADFIFRSDNAGGGGGGAEDLGVLGALGILGEWFPMRHFSFFASAGVRLGFVRNEDVGAFPLLVNGDGFALDFGAGLWGQAGFTVWFS